MGEGNEVSTTLSSSICRTEAATSTGTHPTLGGRDGQAGHSELSFLCLYGTGVIQTVCL